jgi:L-galactose dehydrogenase
LTEKGPPGWHRSPKAVLETGPKIAALCRQYNVNIADVAMRFCLDHPFAASTLVGMSKLRHVRENINVLDFKNPPELLKEIEKLVAPVKNKMWFEGQPENNLGNVPTPEGSHETK